MQKIITSVVHSSENIYDNTVVTSDCTSIVFYNKGEVEFEVNGFPVKINSQPYMMQTSSEFTLDVTKYKIVFKAGAVGKKHCYIDREMVVGRRIETIN